MKISYYLKTDSLYIDLSFGTSSESREVSPGVVIDLDESGQIVGIDIDNASKAVDLSRLEAEELPMNDLLFERMG